VHNVRRMHVVKASQDLVHEVLVVVTLKLLLRVNELVEVSLHKLGDDVHIVIPDFGRRFLNVYELNDILMLEEFQNLNFSKNSLSVNNVFKSLMDSLYSNLLTRPF